VKCLNKNNIRFRPT